MNIIHEIGNESQSTHDMTDREMDRQLEWNQYTSPPTTLLCGGDKNWKHKYMFSYSQFGVIFADGLAPTNGKASVDTLLINT